MICACFTRFKVVCTSGHSLTFENNSAVLREITFFNRRTSNCDFSKELSLRAF